MEIYNRTVLEKIRQNMETRKIQILFGTRQVGKTTILKLIETEIRNKGEQVLRLNLDLPEYFKVFNSYENVLKYLEISGFDLQKKIYLLLDEFQAMNGIGKLMKIIYDEYPMLKIIATGSSSLLINRHIKEGLTGRYFSSIVFHFSFLEFLQTKTDNTVYNMLKKNSYLATGKSQDFLEEYLLFGGYPEVILNADLETKLDLFSSIYTSYLQKDINFFIKYENMPKFSSLVELLADNIGSLININNLSKTLGISYQTIENFIFTLENTFSIKLINPFYNNLSKEIKKMKKVYFYDLGLRNYVLNIRHLPANSGSLAENFAFLEMSRNHDYNIKYWRTINGTEIDFILEKDQKLIPVEVKYRENLNVNIVPANIKSFMESYNIEKAYIITKNQQNVLNYSSKKIIFLPIILSCNIDFD
ncbi:MAG: ATP-binding protein [Candidatus Cloacimonadales bacterium]|nr:ATP-binding protein [Candidatus Cloacimonadales bacterium]